MWVSFFNLLSLLTVLRELMRLHLVIHDHLAHGLVRWVCAHANQPLHLQLVFNGVQFFLVDVVRTKNKYSKLGFDN